MPEPFLYLATMLQTDFLVIGSGIAGLTFAVKMAKRFPDKSITILTKANTDETNTKYAQGGIAVVNDAESVARACHGMDAVFFTSPSFTQRDKARDRVERLGSLAREAGVRRVVRLGAGCGAPVRRCRHRGHDA